MPCGNLVELVGCLKGAVYSLCSAAILKSHTASMKHNLSSSHCTCACRRIFLLVFTWLEGLSDSPEVHPLAADSCVFVDLMLFVLHLGYITNLPAALYPPLKREAWLFGGGVKLRPIEGTEAYKNYVCVCGGGGLRQIQIKSGTHSIFHTKSLSHIRRDVLRIWFGSCKILLQDRRCR